MKVEVVIPEEYMGDVMGNLTPVVDVLKVWKHVGNAQVVRAKVPLSEMFGYSTTLRSSTQGRGVFSMDFRSL